MTKIPMLSQIFVVMLRRPMFPSVHLQDFYALGARPGTHVANGADGDLHIRHHFRVGRERLRHGTFAREDEAPVIVFESGRSLAGVLLHEGGVNGATLQQDWHDVIAGERCLVSKNTPLSSSDVDVRDGRSSVAITFDRGWAPEGAATRIRTPASVDANPVTRSTQLVRRTSIRGVSSRP